MSTKKDVLSGTSFYQQPCTLNVVYECRGKDYLQGQGQRDHQINVCQLVPKMVSVLLFTVLCFQMLGFYVHTCKDSSCASKFPWSQLKETMILEDYILALQECACLYVFQTCVLKLASPLWEILFLWVLQK